MSSMNGVRVVQIAAAGIVLAGYALFLLNVQTSANGWRHADPTGGQEKTLNIPIPEKQPARESGSRDIPSPGLTRKS
jgi:hypothetical protein